MNAFFQDLILVLEFFDELEVGFTFFFVKSDLFLNFDQFFFHFLLDHFEVLDFVFVLFFEFFVFFLDGLFLRKREITSMSSSLNSALSISKSCFICKFYSNIFAEFSLAFVSSYLIFSFCSDSLFIRLSSDFS
jgi:hypothetical protein